MTTELAERLFAHPRRMDKETKTIRDGSPNYTRRFGNPTRPTGPTPAATAITSRVGSGIVTVQAPSPGAAPSSKHP